MKLKTFFTEHAIDPEVTEGLLTKGVRQGKEQASGDRRRPAMAAPVVPRRESSRWVINRLTAVEFTWPWDVDVVSPLGEFLVGNRPSCVWRFGLALIKSSPLLGWGEFEVAHLHHRA